MARRYQYEELLKLRDSPLVAKPANLPPLEEWMGVPPEQNQNPNTKRVPNRGKSEEASHEGNNSRRPAYESRASRNNVSEDIVLGPPRTAFASAGRAKGESKTFDSPGRPSFAANDEDTKGERQNFREKYNKDAAKGDRDGLREGRPENLRLRRDENNERWSNARTPRTPYDDNERAFRRNGDRDFGREKENKESGRGGRTFGNYSRNGDREGNADERRNGQGRGRQELSWYREDEKIDEEPFKSARDTTTRDWREKDRSGGRGEDKDWGRTKSHEPAWMDDPQPEAKNQAHTQEDFQKWKERMKASNAGPQETPASPEPKTNHERTFSGKLKGKAETPLILESNFDGFFGMWGDMKKDNATANGEEQPKRAAGKPSKFTNFFAPKPDSKPIEPAPQTAPLPEAQKDEDKEGFQRILKLLDQQQSSTSHDKPSRCRPRTPPSQPQSRQPESNALGALFGSQANEQRPAPQNRDSEFLLRLMQQPQQSRPPQQPSSPPLSQQSDFNQRASAPGFLPFSNLNISRDPPPQSAPPGNFPPGFLPDEDSHRKPAFRNFFDRPAPNDTMLPPGLQRPPGLDNFPPQQPPRPQMMQPPPGLPPVMRGQESMRGPNPNAFPAPPGMGGPGDRGQQAPQYGGRPPPGLFQMGAPPGFMPHQSFGDGAFGRGPMEGGFGEFGRGGGPNGGYQR